MNNSHVTGVPASRILLTGTPAYGHLLPMLPLVRAAAAAGHDVRLATGPDLVPEMRRRGLAAYPAGPTWEHIVGARDEHLARLTDPSPSEVIVASVQELFGRPGAARLPGLLALSEGWRPDLVVHEPLDVAGPMLARRLGVPSVTHGYGPTFSEYALLGPVVVEAAGEPDLWEYVCDQPYLDVSPASLRPETGSPWRRGLPLRPSAGEDGDGSLPIEVTRLLARRSGRPLVYLTLGTVAHTTPGVLASVVEALRELPLDLVVTTGPGDDPASLGAQPPQVAVVGFLPQAQILARADLVVSQAGAGTMLGALCFGLPQVCLPLGADQPQNAAAVERAGAAVVVAAEDRDADSVRAAVARVVDDPRYGAAARRVRREIDAMPSADAVLSGLTELAAGMQDAPASAS